MDNPLEKLANLLDDNPNIRKALTLMNEYGIGEQECIIQAGDGTPLGAVIVVSGKDECTEILAAIKAVTDGW